MKAHRSAIDPEMMVEAVVAMTNWKNQKARCSSDSPYDAQYSVPEKLFPPPNASGNPTSQYAMPPMTGESNRADG